MIVLWVQKSSLRTERVEDAVDDVRHPELIGLRLIEGTIQEIGKLVNSPLATGIDPAAANDRQQIQLRITRRIASRFTRLSVRRCMRRIP